MCKISVIIPVYNTEQYIRQCLDSVLMQSFKEFEIICVDDCSTDNSLKILNEYSKRDGRLRILTSEENKGAPLARNRGIEIAKGKYIYFLDSDDWIIPDALQIMWDKAEQYNTDVVLFNSCVSAEEVGLGSPSTNWNMGNLYETVMTGEEAFSNIIERNVWASIVWRQFWRKEFLEDNQIRFENKKTAEDWIFTTIALLLTERVVFIDKVLHTYKRHIQSVSFVHNTETLKCYALNYMSMLSFWMSHKFSQKTNYSIKKHMDRLVGRIRRMYVMFEDIHPNEEMLENYIHQHLYCLITNSNQPHLLEREVDRDFVDQFKDYTQIYIYGAAGYAIEMYEQIMKWGINVKGFVVTGFTKAKSIYDLPVYRLEDIALDNEEIFFVLGVSSKNRQDVIDNLKVHGFENYLSLDNLSEGK